MGDRLYLVDASPYIFRAYFSLPRSIVGPGGQPVNAVHGFVTFLLRLLTEARPTHLGIAFDDSLTTSFRNDEYPAYKAHREPPPDDLEAQVPLVREAAAALGAAVLQAPRFEADDVIATIARLHQGSVRDVVVVSSDKDLAQLVGRRTSWLDFARDAHLDADAVEARFGVRPEAITSLLALAGDPVDGIPGVPGVGAKTAVALLAHFSDLEALYHALDEVPSLPIRGARGLARRLAEHRSRAELSLRLARAADDAPLAPTLADLAWKGADPEHLDGLCERLGFGSLRQRLRALEAPG